MTVVEIDLLKLCPVRNFLKKIYILVGYHGIWDNGTSILIFPYVLILLKWSFEWDQMWLQQ